VGKVARKCLVLHPAFDIKTKTWFVDGFDVEAPTIAELLTHFPKGTTVVDYYCAGAQAPRPIYSFSESSHRKFIYNVSFGTVRTAK
jgi:hypothetical protein